MISSGSSSHCDGLAVEAMAHGDKRTDPARQAQKHKRKHLRGANVTGKKRSTKYNVCTSFEELLQAGASSRPSLSGLVSDAFKTHTPP